MNLQQEARKLRQQLDIAKDRELELQDDLRQAQQNYLKTKSERDKYLQQLVHQQH